MTDTQILFKADYRYLIVFQSVAFVASFILLSAANVTPTTDFGYFSIEYVLPLWFWILITGAYFCSVKLFFDGHKNLAVVSVILNSILIRLPLPILTGYPVEIDGYNNADIIRQLTIGDLSANAQVRTTGWPFSYTLFANLKSLAIDELNLLFYSTFAIHAINSFLIYKLMRNFFSEKIAIFSLLLVSIMPTFNFYYYMTWTPQLIAATLWLSALVFVFSKSRRAIYLGLFAFVAFLLIITHHFTPLLLASTLMLSGLGYYIANRIKESDIAENSPKLKSSAFALMGASFLAVFVAYNLVLSPWLFSSVFLSLGYESPSYIIPEALVKLSPGQIQEFLAPAYGNPFGLHMIPVYGMRLIPLIIPLAIFAGFFIFAITRLFKEREIRNRELLMITLSLSIIILVFVSAFALKGLFLEIPRLVDIGILFASPLAGIGMLKIFQNKSYLLFLLIPFIASLSMLAIPIQAVEFSYTDEETKIFDFVQEKFPNSIVYTDWRLYFPATYHMPDIDVKNIPSDPALMKKDGKALVLVSEHSLKYNKYRQVFDLPSEELTHFLNKNFSQLIYQNNGISIYKLEG